MTETEENAAELHRMVEDARSVVCFTGAGISTESGVPDFRSPGSPWLANKPIDFAEFMASEDARAEAWRRKFVMDDVYRGAKPGRGHRALASLVRSGRSVGIITQNIDGLHQLSGLADAEVIELHGNGTYATCLHCGLRHELGPIRAEFEREGRAPTCRSCGGIVKSATVAFGQAMPANAMRRAREWTLGCDLMLVVGSSLVVYPAAGFPLLAKRNGARLAIVNREPTEHDAIADLVVTGEIGPIFDAFARVS